MSNRRNLKKIINNTMELLYIDCLFYKDIVGADKEAADKIIYQINAKHNEFLSRMSVNEGKNVRGRVKLYYKKLEADFVEQVNELGKEISALP